MKIEFKYKYWNIKASYIKYEVIITLLRQTVEWFINGHDSCRGTVVTSDARQNGFESSVYFTVSCLEIAKTNQIDWKILKVKTSSRAL